MFYVVNGVYCEVINWSIAIYNVLGTFLDTFFFNLDRYDTAIKYQYQGGRVVSSPTVGVSTRKKRRKSNKNNVLMMM